MRTEELASLLVEQYKKQGRTLASAESCTGGGIGFVLTSIPGSSAVFSGGVISYTNQVKEKLLSVPADILDRFGAVSAETAEYMARGVRLVIGADVGISVTGLAGPDSDGSGKPVGLVYVGASDKEKTVVEEYCFSGDRASVRDQAIQAAVRLAMQM